jgi:hypothetical protein
MKKIFVYTMLLLVFVTFSWIRSNSDDAQKDGKTICINAKCNMCHALAKAEIEVKNKNSKAPDLGTLENISDKTDFLIKFLNKEETLNDKKHPIKFSGTEDELKILVAWLIDINKPAPKN